MVFHQWLKHTQLAFNTCEFVLMPQGAWARGLRPWWITGRPRNWWCALCKCPIGGGHLDGERHRKSVERAQYEGQDLGLPQLAAFLAIEDGSAEDAPAQDHEVTDHDVGYFQVPAPEPAAAAAQVETPPRPMIPPLRFIPRRPQVPPPRLARGDPVEEGNPVEEGDPVEEGNHVEQGNAVEEGHTDGDERSLLEEGNSDGDECSWSEEAISDKQAELASRRAAKDPLQRAVEEQAELASTSGVGLRRAFQTATRRASQGPLPRWRRASQECSWRRGGQQGRAGGAAGAGDEGNTDGDELAEPPEPELANTEGNTDGDELVEPPEPELAAEDEGNTDGDEQEEPPEFEEPEEGDEFDEGDEFEEGEEEKANTEEQVLLARGLLRSLLIPWTRTVDDDEQALAQGDEGDADELAQGGEGEEGDAEELALEGNVKKETLRLVLATGEKFLIRGEEGDEGDKEELARGDVDKDEQLRLFRLLQEYVHRPSESLL